VDNELQKRIKSLRELRGWSQGRLAEASGVSRATINGLEAGRSRPVLDTVEAIAKAFGLTLSEFYAGQEAQANG
jgi:transcriptional regulator with XRE-family HTH domain